VEAVDRALAAVRGAVVDDQEHAPGFVVGLDAHELVDERVEWLDAVLGRAAIEDLGALGVPGGEVAERALALVLVFDALAAWRPAGCRQRAVLALARLDRGFLVGADDVVAGVQSLALPAALVEVEDRAGLGGEVRVTREDPRAVLPRLDRVRR
jgi:hypothetical protein